jgi:hypothetical protein
VLGSSKIKGVFMMVLVIHVAWLMDV